MRIDDWLIERSLPFVFFQFFDSGPAKRIRSDSRVSNFQVGENVFLFLKQEDCRLAGWYQGKYIIEGDMAYPAGPGCTEKLSGDLAIPLEDLKQEIRILVAGGSLPSN